ncbi:hypothetical protein EYD45_03160 [Hyunsoonleella flava]|uniref:Uncharacterized protein n=1 Tax=Hyunsoonleella flava TaxID=2527939 RepID=A0A4Q9FGE8_9FLAO|nr:hypothetical protein [Hyunsoonleella flava]TBN05290.1 hypothetical protein EYD45_03160 [Hyunsoonleella flava]
MKTKTLTLKILLLFVLLFFTACSKNEELKETRSTDFAPVEVTVEVPDGANLNMTSTKMYSLSVTSDVTDTGTGMLPFNESFNDLAFLLDENDNVLLAAFLTNNRKEISIETTAEVLVYYALDYYLLPNKSKEKYIKAIQETGSFDDLITNLKELFAQNNLMFQQGAYFEDLNSFLSSLTSKHPDIKDISHTGKRIFTKDKRTKSGITVANDEDSNVILQNSYPRRGKVFIYKKTSLDRDGVETQLSNYTDTPFLEFDLEPGKTLNIEAFKVGFKVSQMNAQSSAIENTVSSDPINLPVSSSEYSAGYEFVILGSGDLSNAPRALTDKEQIAYNELTKEAYILDYFLPTLLDVGGNKELLPPPGDPKEQALANAVLPILEANPEVLEAVINNDFKTATELFLPELYSDVRLSDDLRDILNKVYGTLSEDKSSPNTFIQSQELVSSGHPRLQKVLSVVYKNMDLKTKGNIPFLRTDANAIEDWFIKSIDADVNISNDIDRLCLGQPTEIRVGVITEYEPDFEEVEFHWQTSGEFKGRIQDINDNPNNFGTSIITKTNSVSYISVAQESELGSGDNIETVEVIIYMKNKRNGQLSEVGRDSMTINHKICVSFYVGFQKEVKILENENALICGGNTEYTVGHPTFVAKFSAVDDAKSYKGRVKRKDGTFAAEFQMQQINDLGGGNLEYKLGVGPIHIIKTCNLEQAEEEQQKKFDYLDEVGHQGIEITPIF